MRKLSYLLLAFVFVFSACKKDVDNTYFGAGVFITNEGNYGSGNGTLSVYNRSTGQVTNNAFQAVNSRPLGDVVQSVALHNDRVYIVVNNSDKVEVTDKNLVSLGTITGIPQPRYFLGVTATKGYVSYWGNGGGIEVVDLTTMTVTDHISTGAPVEGMTLLNGKVYACNNGGFGSDNKVAVIDVATDHVDRTFNVGDNPINTLVDASGKLWIMNGGKKIYDSNPPYALDTLSSTNPCLLVADPATGMIEHTFIFNDRTAYVGAICMNAAKDAVFYTYAGGVYSMSIGGTLPPTTPLISRSSYSLGLDPAENKLYLADARDYASEGRIYRYTLAGSLIDSFSVGIIPGNFGFAE